MAITLGDILRFKHGEKKMPKPKKLMFHQVQKWDQDNHDSFIRLIEMKVDSIAAFNVGITAQFFQDARLYGFDEAILYLIGYTKRSEEDTEIVDLRKMINILREKIHVTSNSRVDN